MKNYLVALLLTLISFWILLIGINKPLNGHHDWNARFFSKIAQNYIDKGVINLKFGQLIGENYFYTHHPPLFPLILATSIKTFGDYPWSIRLMPIIFSSVTIGLFYLLLKRYYSFGASLIACLFIFVTPMFAYFGKMANHEVFTLFFIVLTIYFFVSNRSKLSLAALFFAQWTGWPGFYLGGLLFLFSKDKKYLLLTVMNFAMFLWNVYSLTGSIVGGGLDEILFFRMGFTNLPSVKEEYTNWQLIVQESKWLYHFFTPPMVWLSIFGVFKIKKPAVLFILIAFTHVLLFRTGAWRHDYWLYYFLPVFSWTIASGITFFEKKYKLPAYLVYLGFLYLAFYQSQPFFWALQTMVENTF